MSHATLARPPQVRGSLSLDLREGLRRNWMDHLVRGISEPKDRKMSQARLARPPRVRRPLSPELRGCLKGNWTAADQSISGRPADQPISRSAIDQPISRSADQPEAILGVLEASWAILGASWAVGGPKKKNMQQLIFQHLKNISGVALFGPSWRTSWKPLEPF